METKRQRFFCMCIAQLPVKLILTNSVITTAIEPIVAYKCCIKGYEITLFVLQDCYIVAQYRSGKLFEVRCDYYNQQSDNKTSIMTK